MGDHLDEEIKETVHDWAENPQGESYDNLDDRIDAKLRRTIAGWVGSEPDADWKSVGVKMDANTRVALARWVGAEEQADWNEITARMENRIRTGVARLVRAERGSAAESEATEPSWGDIGTKIERDVRGWVSGLVGTESDSDWGTITNQAVDHVRAAFDKITRSEKKKKADKPYGPSGKITIEGEEEPPVVASSEPVDPDH